MNDMTIEDLELRYEELGEECDDIQLSLDRSAGLAAEEGVYASAEWYASTKHALACRRREYNGIARLLAKKRKAEKRKRATTFGETFIKVARETLDPACFREIMNQVRDEAAEDQQDG